MTRKAYLPLGGSLSPPAMIDSGFPAKPGDRVWLVNCHDRLTGTTTSDVWFLRDDLETLDKFKSSLNSFADDIIFSFQGECEIKADETGCLYIEVSDNFHLSDYSYDGRTG